MPSEIMTVPVISWSEHCLGLLPQEHWVDILPIGKLPPVKHSGEGQGPAASLGGRQSPEGALKLHWPICG